MKIYKILHWWAVIHHAIQDSFLIAMLREIQNMAEYSLIHGWSGIKTFKLYNKQSFNLHWGADNYPQDFDELPTKEGNNLEEVSARLVSSVLIDRHKHNKKSPWPIVNKNLKNGVLQLLDEKAITMRFGRQNQGKGKCQWLAIMRRLMPHGHGSGHLGSGGMSFTGTSECNIKMKE